MSAPVVLIDGSGWLYRAFHALPPLTSPAGEPTGAVYGMGNMLRRLLRDHAREDIVVVFDAPGKTFRDDLFTEYKAHREAVPADLSTQFPVILELIHAMGLPVLQMSGVEADDVIGTLTQQALSDGHEVLIVTGDKDLAQLVSERVTLLDTMKDRRLDPSAVRERFGVDPRCIADLLALTGDTSDNIPGVPLVGPKTAARWLSQYGSLDGVIAHAAELSGKAGENLRNGLAQLALSRELARIRCDLDLPVTLGALSRPASDGQALAALYERLGFRRWREELTPAAVLVAAAPAPAAPPPPPLASVAETVLDWEAFERMLRQLEEAPLLCLDTETDALDCQRAGLVGLAFAVTPGRGWYVPLGHRYVGAPAQLPMAEVLERLRPLLEDPARPKVGQHIKYDLHVLRRHGVRVQGVRYDTMLESYVLDSGHNRHDMDTLAEKHLQHRTIHFEDVAGRGRHQLSFDQVPVEPAAAYSAEDADVTLRLHQALYPRLQQTPSLQQVFETIEMPLVPVLSRMEEYGVRVDVPLLAKISAEFAQRMEALEVQAHAQAGVSFNIGSPSQLQKILFDDLQLRAGARTAGGARSTAEDVLQELAAVHPLPQTVLDWRTISKLRSTYTETLAREVNPATGRIHTSYHQAAAATGRLSSSDPNLQNIPVRTAEGRRVRQAFIAADGDALLSVDYSQIELRLMAHFSADERLQAAFRADRDVHRATAAEVFGRAHDEVSSAERRAAKAINFGLIYGISSFGLARQLGISRAQAQEYIDAFFARYPDVKRFMEQTRLRAREQGYVETLFGRRLYLPEIQSRNAAQRQYAERTAINAPLQGTAADLIKLAMIDLHAWLPSHAPEVRMLLQVHDELVFEGPRERLFALTPTLCQRMCSVAELSVPLTAEAGLADNWEAARNSPVPLPGG